MKLELDDIKSDWKRATEGLAEWRTEAMDSYDFASVRQWDAESVAKLEEEGRPGVTFDRIGVFVDAVCGMEINNRQAIKYFPVEQGDIRVNDMITQAVKYYENDCGAEDEDSEAVRDAVICGVGCTETIISTEFNPDGAPTVLRRDPLSVWYDPDASRRNLKDRRFVFHGDWVNIEEAEKRWPDGNFSSEMPWNPAKPHYADRAFQYEDNAAKQESHEHQVFVLHYQCWKREDVYRLKDPQSGHLINLSKAQFTAAKKLFAEQFGREPVEARKNVDGDYVKSTHKVYYRAFLSGDDILEQDKLPVQKFTFNFITYKRDRNQRSWYGLVRSMKDPQKWANKWLSQILHIMNTNAKGGAYAEVGAFPDARKAEDQWAQANPLILLKEGAIDKIRERGQAQYPSGLDRMMQFAFNALPMVSGLNLEVLGLADREQAGVVETQRKQSAYQLLAPLFSAIREYRRERGKLMLEFLKFVPDNTLIRIVGKGKEQWVPLAKDQLTLTYDVKVDQAPDSPDYKKQIWEAMGQILPPMMKAGYPVPPEVLNYSPLPPDVSEAWVQWIKTQGWMPPEHKQQMEQMSKMMQQMGQENMKLKEENMTLRLDRSAEFTKLEIKQKDNEDRTAIKLYQTEIESLNRRLEAAVQEQRDIMNAVVSSQKNQGDLRVKATQATIQHIEAVTKQLQALESMVKTQGETVQKLDKRKPPKAKVSRMKDGVYQIEFPEAAG